ncbi:hypothetical protein H4R18_004161 [Coemansia javaensis]|uniref:Uncharacterized protein n=1 Tax=Coemansia javaensis TaxID=2761396 RepID=A0A9W8H6I1_9FUNG|nr:hypothetical protein H4R18_004161 [Coemansia javaensis]
MTASRPTPKTMAEAPPRVRRGGEPGRAAVRCSEDGASALWGRVSPGSHARGPHPRLAYVLYQLAPRHIACALVTRLVAELVPVLIPILVRMATVFAQHKRRAAERAGAAGPPSWQGYLLVLGMFAMLLVYSWSFQWFFFEIGKAAVIVRSALVSAIYRKSLVLSAQARARLTLGKMTNLISSDISQVERGITNAIVCITIPIQVVVSVVVLVYMIGPPSISGWGLIVASVPAQMWVARYLVALRSRAVEYTDKRIRATREALQGVKVVKAFAWEDSVLENVRRIRSKEVAEIARLNLARYALISLALHTPVFAAVITFAIVALTGSRLSNGPVFAAIGIFNAMSLPMSWLPVALTEAKNTLVPLRRIAEALLEDEVDPEPAPCPDPGVAVQITRGVFAWDRQDARSGHGQGDAHLQAYRFPQPSPLPIPPAAGDAAASSPFVLGELSIEIPRGCLVAVIGPVGSGKSSLASALVGEMSRVSGSILRSESLAYAPQVPWVMNATIRENILFGRPFDAQRYADVVEACALEADLASMPAGDQTEVGERGVTLSGGQKQRVSVARAAYSDSELLVLDDCLSAVDVKTSRTIFKHCIKGLLARKTRVLVTSSLDYLPSTDLVIAMDGGRIVECGAFLDLLVAGGTTASLYRSFIDGAEQVPDACEPYATDSSLHTATPIREVGDGSSCADRDVRNLRLSDAIFDSISACTDATSTKSSTSGAGSRHAWGRAAARSSGPAEKGPGPGASSGELGAEQAAAGALMSQEERPSGQISWPTYLAYIRAGGGYALLGGIVVCIAVSQGCRVAGDFWIRLWVRHRQDDPHRYIWVYALLGSLQLAWFALFALLLTASVYMASARLHARAFERVLRSPMSFFDTTPLGRILNRFTRDIDSVDLALCDFFRQFYQNIARSVGAFVTISLIVPVFLAPLVPLFVASCALVYFYLRTSVEIQRVAATSRSPLYAHYAETLQGLATIRAYAAHGRFVQRADRVLDDANRPHWYAVAVQSWVWLRVDYLSHALTLAICLIVIAQPSRWDAAAVGLMLVQATQMGSYATYAGRGWSELQNNMNAVERLDHYAAALPQEPSTGREQSDAAAAAATTAISVRTATRAWPERGTVIVRGLSMRYRPGLPLALDGVDMEMYSGERVGIVGRSGAGKSSIVAALFRFADPCGGKVFIDGIDTQTLPLARLRRAIGILPQDPVLFEGTLRTNLDPFGSFSDAELWASLRHACLHELAAQHPLGLDMPVSEGGESLSAGQRQLLCLARVLVRRPRILVLDEATASVDHETDAAIQRIVSSSDWGMTVVSIAHRLQTVIAYDRIYVIDGGRVIETGAPLSLLERHMQPAGESAGPDSAFYRMVCEMDDRTVAHMLARACGHQAELEQRGVGRDAESAQSSIGHVDL